MYSQFKIGDKVIYIGNHSGDGWKTYGVYTVDKIYHSLGKNFITPKEVLIGNDHEEHFISAEGIEGYSILKSSHSCEPVEMGFMHSKKVCKTCDREF